MKFPFKTIALIGKHSTPEIGLPLLELASFLAGKGIGVMVDELTAPYLGEHPYTVATLEQMGRTADLAVVLGGDGTMLNIVCALAPHKVPLAGVNQGRLGFLTDISLDNMLPTIGAMLEGRFVTEQRTLLHAKVLREGTEPRSALAFNEVVMHRGGASSMMEFEVSIDGEHLYKQRADGLIAATPTGSTAYALSAGGPIVHPGLDIITLVPVCPHALSNRPIVLKSHSVLEVLIHRCTEANLRLDSHTRFEVCEGDRVVVSRSPEPACLLHPEGHSYYHTLREKLLWNKTY